jgi:hypothetical protein
VDDALARLAQCGAVLAVFVHPEGILGTVLSGVHGYLVDGET